MYQNFVLLRLWPNSILLHKLWSWQLSDLFFHSQPFYWLHSGTCIIIFWNSMSLFTSKILFKRNISCKAYKQRKQFYVFRIWNWCCIICVFYLQKVTKLLVEENKNINTKVCVDTKTKYVWKIKTFLYQRIKTVTLNILLIQYFTVYNILRFNQMI